MDSKDGCSMSRCTFPCGRREWFGLGNTDGFLWPIVSLTMMTSSNGIFTALLALCEGNSPVTGEFPSQRPVTRSFDAFFDLCLNKRLSKQSWGCWFETPSRSLWRHCNDINQTDNYMIHNDLITGSKNCPCFWHLWGESADTQRFI